MTEPRLTSDGVTIIRGAVPEDVVDCARAAVLRSVRPTMTPSDIVAFTQRTFTPELACDARLLDLYRRNRARDFCERLVAPDSFSPVDRAQVQIRLPATGLAQPPKQLHVDGLACPHLPGGTRNTFTLLVGVLLTPVWSVEDGALQVARGGHATMATWLREHSIQELPQHNQVPSIAETLPRVTITGQPGDAVVLHHLTPHAAGANAGKSPRVMVYFRLRHCNHDALADRALTEPWLELPAARSLGV